VKAALDHHLPGTDRNRQRRQAGLKDDSVVVAVHAASINPIDDILRSGTMKDTAPLTFPRMMGYDVSVTFCIILSRGKGAEHGYCHCPTSVSGRTPQSQT